VSVAAIDYFISLVSLFSSPDDRRLCASCPTARDSGVTASNVNVISTSTHTLNTSRNSILYL
jgi:hypothetical protein